MIFVDTGYLIAVIDPDDALHQRALAWSQAVRGPYVTTSAVLLELFGHVCGTSLRQRPLAIVDQLSSKSDWEILSVDPPLFGNGLDLYRSRPDKSWSLTDCISFTIMSDRAITQALAYDHHFEQAGFDPLLRRDPA